MHLEANDNLLSIRSLLDQRHTEFNMQPKITNQVHLRDINQADLPRMYEFNLDPDANLLAMTVPRSADAFYALWEKILAGPDVLAKAIAVGDLLAGYISCFKMDGLDSVGYWVDKQFWGKGVASRALELFLEVVPVRPLHAGVATSNVASLRVLQKCGFVIQSVQVVPATDRFLACEEALLLLK